VWVLEERGHSPDQVVFYVPAHRFLHAADLTDAYFPLWPDSDGAAQERALRRVLAMARAGHTQLLTDGHHHEVYRGSKPIVRFLEELLSINRGFRDSLNCVFEKEDGLTAAAVYDRLRARPDDEAVRWHLEQEYPATPLNLQQTIVLYLLDMGYRAEGPWRRKRFYRPNGGETAL
jgi:glyoxylase-like metal-dependent hydrolase (beta-lactamase superfamily II)